MLILWNTEKDSGSTIPHYIIRTVILISLFPAKLYHVTHHQQPVHREGEAGPEGEVKAGPGAACEPTIQPSTLCQRSILL